jgi:hypothetical protein
VPSRSRPCVSMVLPLHIAREPPSASLNATNNLSHLAWSRQYGPRSFWYIRWFPVLIMSPRRLTSGVSFLSRCTTHSTYAVDTERLLQQLSANGAKWLVLGFKVQISSSALASICDKLSGKYQTGALWMTDIGRSVRTRPTRPD